MSFPNIHALSGSEPYRESSVRGAIDLGAMGVMPDGRRYLWCRNGAVALAAGRVVQSELPGANFDALVIDGAHAIGEKTITITNGGTAITANMFRYGYLNVEASTGNGQLYRIASHPAADTSATCVITLETGLAVAVGASATVTLLKHPCDSVIIHPSPPTACVIGVPNIAVTASYYFWAQVYGPCSVLTDGTIVAGKTVMISDAVNGAVEPWPAGAGDDEICVGRVMEVAADTECSPIFLTLD